MAVRTLGIKVTIDDIPVRVVDRAGAWSFQQSFGQGVSSGTLLIQSPQNTPTAGQRVKVWVGWNGALKLRFSGFIVNPQRRSIPRNQWVIQVADALWKADQVRQLVTLSPTNDWNAREACLTLLRDYAGISASLIALPELPASGSGWSGAYWRLFQQTPAVFSESKSILEHVQEIYGTLGYWVFADASGLVRAVQLEGIPTSAAATVYTEGVNLYVEGAPQTQASYDQIYNRAEVTGAPVGVEGANLRDSFAVNHPLLPANVVRTKQVTNPYLEFENVEEAGQASVTAVCQRLVKIHSRIPLSVTARTKFDPTIHVVGKSVQLTSSRLEIDQSFFLYEINESAGGATWDAVMRLDGGINPDDGTTTIPGPIASFSYDVHAETLDTTDHIEVFVDGSSSISPTGQIVSWEWTDGTTTGSGETFVFIYPDGSPNPTITLTVVDTTSKSDSISQEIDLAGDISHAITRRVLTVAEGNRWSVTRNGGKNWAYIDGEATIAVPPIGPLGGLATSPAAAALVGLIATGGGSGQTIRQTTNYLAVAPTTIATLAGQIRFLWHDEQDPTRVYAAVGAAIYRALDGGTTWSALPNNPSSDDVNWVQGLYPGAIEVLAGNRSLWSYDQGTTWIEMLVGPDDTVARCYAAGPTTGGGRHWIGFTGCPTGASPLRSTEGDIAVFPGASPEVLDIRALTMLLTTPVLIAIDAQGRIWHLSAEDGSNAVTTVTIDTATYGDVMFAIRDGDYPVVYIVCQKAVLKYWPSAPQVAVFKSINYPTDSGHMIGYDGLAQPSVSSELLFLTDGVYVTNPAYQGLWRYRYGEWNLDNGDLPSAVLSRSWRTIVASTANADHMMIFGLQSGASAITDIINHIYVDSIDNYSPVFITFDGGATWTPVELEAFGTGTNMQEVGWNRHGEWVVLGSNGALQALFGGGIELWSGVANDPTATKYIDEGQAELAEVTCVSDGLGVEFVFLFGDRPGGGTNGGFGFWFVGADQIGDTTGNGDHETGPRMDTAPDATRLFFFRQEPFVNQIRFGDYSDAIGYATGGLNTAIPDYDMIDLAITKSGIYVASQDNNPIQRYNRFVPSFTDEEFVDVDAAMYRTFRFRAARQRRDQLGASMAVYGIPAPAATFDHAFVVNQDDGLTWISVPLPPVLAATGGTPFGVIEVLDREVTS